MKKITKYAIAGVLVVGLGWYLVGNSEPERKYVTAKVVKGDILEKITATGTINPISTVNIGTQVSGTIAEIFVDYNSQVKKGQVLAQIDPALFQATVDRQDAALSIAKAQVDVVNNDLIYYKKHLTRIRKLNSSKYSADAELEAAERDYNNALVQLELRRAEVKQAEASLKSAEIDLKYTKIVSPVDGIVVSKEVEVGQTVAASFQTPTLFNVAEDLTKMQIETSVVEADIAKVKEGQTVEFSVDSYPDEKFSGIVTQVRNEAITTSNVVTYEVIIEIDNRELKLKPGMTANVEIITAEEKGVLLVPNKALRFFIEEEDGTTKRYKDKGVWILKSGVPVRVSIVSGVSDEDNTVVASELLNEHIEVIVDEKGRYAPQNGNSRLRMPR